MIADLQATQFSRSEIKTGETLPEYSENSVNVFGKRPGPWTLYDQGDFYRAIQIIKIDSKGWELTSLDDKTFLIRSRVRKKMGSKSAANLFGLNSESRSDLTIPHIRPALREAMEEQTGLKFKS